MAFLSRVAAKPVVVTQNAASLMSDKRIEYDLDHLSGVTAAVSVQNPPNLRELLVKVKPPQPSIWAGTEFHFVLRFSDSYPNEAPTCHFIGGPGPRPPRMWHPNIEGDEGKTEWGVCINILRKDWTPVMGVKDVVLGIEMLFFEPVPEDPLPGTAKLAAQQLHDDPRAFERKTKEWAKGNYVR